jgi:hypothetical protein
MATPAMANTDKNQQNIKVFFSFCLFLAALITGIVNSEDKVKIIMGVNISKISIISIPP